MRNVRRTIWLATAAAVVFWSALCFAGYGVIALLGGVVETHAQGLALHPMVDPWIAAVFGATQDAGPIILAILWGVVVALILGFALTAQFLSRRIGGARAHGLRWPPRHGRD